MCHLLMAMPFLGLLLFRILPMRSALPLYFVVLFFSAVFYFLMFRAMSAKVVSGKEGMVGRTCRAVTSFDKEGKVTYGNEIWFAESSSPVGPGEEIRIVGFRDLVLLVEPASRSTGGEGRERIGSKLARFASCCFHKKESKKA